jgi:leader peptidase (prepilin peptidase)/N-methyltransferase
MIILILNHPVYAPLFAAILGAILGSFIAALVARWPVHRRISEGRSRCDACGGVLRWYELVPVISYLLQQGRCRRCDDVIDSDTIAIEIAAGLIGAVPFLYFLGPEIGSAMGASSADDPLSPGAIAAIKLALFGWLLLPLAWLDFRHYWLPNALVLALALGAVMLIIGLQWHLGSLDFLQTGRAITQYHLLSGAIGFATLWLVSKAYLYLRGREGLGGGDPKLFGAIGMWTGWEALPFILLFAAALGLILALVAMAGGRDITGTTRFPFGTLLALSAWPLYFYQIQGGVY